MSEPSMRERLDHISDLITLATLQSKSVVVPEIPLSADPGGVPIKVRGSKYLPHVGAKQRRKLLNRSGVSSG